MATEKTQAQPKSGQVKAANPAPLGSLGFGMTTILYSIVAAGFYEINAMLFAMAIFLGGSAQLLAGYLEYKRGNTFGFTSYTMFGFYWLTLVALTILPTLGLAEAASSQFMGWFFLLWTLFCLILLLKSLKLGSYTVFVFSVVLVLFATITLSSFTEAKFFATAAGYLGMLAGALAMFSAYRSFDE